MRELVITANEAGQRFDKYLRKYLKEMPLSGIYKSIRKKEITVNGNKASEKYLLNTGDIIRFNIEIDDVKKEKKLGFLNMDYNIKPSYEDRNILIVQKDKGVLVHPDDGNENTLTDEVKAYLYEKGEYNVDDETTFSPSPCNRLDRNTEGLIIFAKNYDALKAVNESIRNGEIEKYYLTIVKGKIEDGLYRAYMIKDQNKNKVKIMDNYVDGSKEVITKVKMLESVGIFSEVEVNLITGRSHQIRAHLSYLNNPIIGDTKYGDKETNKYYKSKYGLESQLLIGYKMIFKNCSPHLKYLDGKVVTMPLPPIYKKIRKDLFKF